MSSLKAMISNGKVHFEVPVADPVSDKANSEYLFANRIALAEYIKATERNIIAKQQQSFVKAKFKSLLAFMRRSK